MNRSLKRLKFSVVQAVPLGLRSWDAAAMIGISEESLERCRLAGWIEPSVESHALVLYEHSAVERCWQKIKREGRLPSKQEWSKPRANRVPDGE